jgi:hypothetical protein
LKGCQIPMLVMPDLKAKAIEHVRSFLKAHGPAVAAV